MWTIDKQFSFCYGHRVWSQELNAEYCEEGDTKPKCRHLHGHEGLAHVFLESDVLERGMVADFKHLGWLKNFLDRYLDHRFVIDRDDPMYYRLVTDVHKDLTGMYTCILDSVVVPGTDHVVGQVINLDRADRLKNTAGYETLDGYFIVNFVPTSENLSKWLFDLTQAKMNKIGVKVSKVDWFETPKSRSSYCGE